MTSTAVPRSTARLRRIDLRVVIGLALLLAGVLGTVAVVERAGQRVPVLVVAIGIPGARFHRLFGSTWTFARRGSPRRRELSRPRGPSRA